MVATGLHAQLTMYEFLISKKSLTSQRKMYERILTLVIKKHRILFFFCATPTPLQSIDSHPHCINSGNIHNMHYVLYKNVRFHHSYHQSMWHVESCCSISTRGYGSKVVDLFAERRE